MSNETAIAPPKPPGFNAPQVPQTSAPTPPNLPSTNGQDESTGRKPRNPRFSPPAGEKFREFPFDEFEKVRTKYSYPIQEDFDDSGPFYERFVLARVESQMKPLLARKEQMEAEIKIWEESGGDKELVAAKRQEMRLKSKIAENIGSGAISMDDLAAMVKRMGAENAEALKALLG